MKPEHPAVLRFKCPWCGARRGQRCKTPKGVRMAIPHARRHRLVFP